MTMEEKVRKCIQDMIKIEDYWKKEVAMGFCTPNEAIEGMTFSILAMIDGEGDGDDSVYSLTMLETCKEKLSEVGDANCDGGHCQECLQFVSITGTLHETYCRVKQKE